MIKYILVFIISIILASLSQILLKKSANVERKNKINEYLNYFVISAYLILFISTLLTMFAYRGLQLSQGMILETISYILIPIFSYFIFKEKFNKRKIIGIVTIIIGIAVFSIFG